MGKVRTKRGNKLKWGIIIALVLIVSFGLVYMSLMMQSNIVNDDTTQINTQKTNSYLDSSVLNGALFTENDVYNTYDDKKLYYIYVTAMPTVDDKTNEPITLDDLNRVTQPDQNPVVEVLFQEGDENGPYKSVYKSSTLRANATMKVRGFSARVVPQKSFKIELSGVADEFLGQDILNLNKHAKDPLRISNKFCMDAFEEISDIGSLNTYFIKMYIRDLSNGSDTGFVDYGLFTMVEQPNKSYLRSHGLDSNGSLYKAIDFSFGDYQTEIKSENDAYYDKEEFETILEIRENPNHEKIIEMIDAINDRKNNINDVVNTYFNRENYITWMATNIIFGNIDATANNFLLYCPVNSKTWYFVPWDYDKTLLYSKLEIEDGYSHPPSLYGLSNFWGATLHNRFFKDPKNLEDLNNRIDEIMKKNLSPKKCEELSNNYIQIFEKASFGMPDVAHLVVSADEMAYYSENIYDILTYFVDLHYENLEPPMPIYLSGVERVGKSYKFEWDRAYDMQGDVVTYDLEIARDLDFQNIVFSKKDLISTSYTTELDLQADTYYYSITVTDEKGNKQTNLETYVDPFSGGIYFGFIPFEVD